MAELAERQSGVVALHQLIGLGMSADTIRHWLDVGWLRRIHRCVFAVGYEPLTRAGSWWAAILATGEGAVLSHGSAAALWGLLPERESTVHVIVSAVQRRRHRDVVPHRHRLGKGETTVHCGIPVTSPRRTLIDLAAHVGVVDLERAIRQAEYDHLERAASLAAVLASLERRRGVRNLRRALDHVTDAPGLTRSRLEEKFLAFLRRHSLPRPKLNVVVCGYEVDCLWATRGVIAELDGRGAHTTSTAFESDRARDSALQAAGHRVVRITWRRLHDDGATLAAELRALLTRRE